MPTNWGSTAAKLGSGIGCLTAALIILLVLTAIQGMSGEEGGFGLALFFSLGFALGFGIGGSCLEFLRRGRKFLISARVYAIGGAIGGAFLALSLKSIGYFEQHLRALTGGRPLSIFLLAAIVCAVLIPFVIARIILKRH